MKQIVAIALLSLMAGWTAFAQKGPSPVVVKALLDFDRVDASPVPSIEDSMSCAQSNAAAIAVVRPEERFLYLYRKGYCELFAAILTGASGSFRAASGDFGEAIAEWPARMPFPPPSALQALVTIARLEQGRRADAFTDLVRDLNTSVTDPACPASPLMSVTFCAGVIDTAKTWLGWLALRKGNLPEASKYLASMPSNPWTAWVSGRIAQSQKRLSEADAFYKKATEGWNRQTTNPDVVGLLGPKPDRLDTAYQLGLFDYESRRFPSAIARLDTVLRESQKNSYALYIRGRAKQELEQFGLALEDYAAAIQAAQATNDASWPVGQAHFARGELLYRQKDFARAESEFVLAQTSRLSEVPQADVSAWRALSAVSGSSCAASLDTLESLYRTASDQFPKAEAAALIIDCRYKQASNLEQYLAVEKQYGERLDPARRRDLRNHISVAYADQGGAAEDRKDPMAAAEAYLQALQWNPGNAKARFNLGAIYIEGKRFQQAEEQYRALVEADADDYEALYWLGASILAQHPPPERVATACEILRHSLLVNDSEKRAQFNKLFTSAKCPR